MKLKKYCVLLLLLICSSINALTDLNSMCQDFILETKQIIIPQYPSAFNPSIIRWNDQLLLFFRIRDPLTNSTNQIGITLLDDDFNPVNDPQLLEILLQWSTVLPVSLKPQVSLQDPRVIAIGDTLYIVYSNLVSIGSNNVSRMCISKIYYDGVKFYGGTPDVLVEFDGMVETKKEKNWVPFNYDNHLFLGYSLVPHKIFMPIPRTNTCVTLATTAASTKNWYWGELRGGTPALLVDGDYLAFFHSSKGMATVQSQGERITHYYMGAYTFSSHYPFDITKISPCPLVHPSFYDGPAHDTWKPIRVVFPCGYVHDQDYIWVSYGKQDFEMWIAKIDKQKLLQSLVPVDNID